MDLLLIRHGQSNANAKGLLISTEHDELTELGKTQSVRLATSLNEFGFNQPTLLFCSPWMRAKQTATLVFGPSAPIQYDSRLAETHPGRFGTWLETDFNRINPDFNSDIRNKYEQGESHLDMANRVAEWLDMEILAHTHKSGLAAVVAHGGPISVMIQKLLGIPIETHYPSFTVPNASFTYLKWRSNFGRYCLERAGHI